GRIGGVLWAPAGGGAGRSPGGRRAVGGRGAAGAPPTDGTDRAAAELYPRLLAAVAGTAVRVSVQHWCERPDELAFADVFREVFDLLAAGLPAPAR
ncbi:TetR family transcriptional regulator, partial [Streptomyces pseudogriseolus]|uniref:acyl-CoA-like ligand-binding transcription factor n=2 Tax=Streptomyces pseudogriseolus TaxID=36817 RepID=UPI003489ACD8